MALGVLTQPRGLTQQPVGYLSKKIDTVAKGWRSCLRAVAAVALLIPEAVKLTLGRDLTVYTPHAVVSLLNTRGGLWLSDNPLLRNQALLLEGPAVQIKTCPALNPASFLPEEGEALLHDCELIILQTYAAREDLQEEPLSNPDLVLFTDTSSDVEQGIRKAGCAVVSLKDTVESQPLPRGLAHNSQN